MKEKRYQIGPGAASLILLIVVLCMTVLGILSLISARADRRMAQRAVEMTRGYYAADEQVERALSQLDACLRDAAQGAPDHETYLTRAADTLPDGWTMDDGTAYYSADAGANRTLECAAKILPPDNVAGRYRTVSRALGGGQAWQDEVFEEVW